MNINDLVLFLVKSVAKDKESISISKIETENEDIIEVIISEDDMKRVIGKNGSVINSIRTLTSSAAYANNLKRTKVNVDYIK